MEQQGEAAMHVNEEDEMTSYEGHVVAVARRMFPLPFGEMSRNEILSLVRRSQSEWAQIARAVADYVVQEKLRAYQEGQEWTSHRG
jgi:hypothetical protein